MSVIIQYQLRLVVEQLLTAVWASERLGTETPRDTIKVARSCLPFRR